MLVVKSAIPGIQIMSHYTLIYSTLQYIGNFIQFFSNSNSNHANGYDTAHRRQRDKNRTITSTNNRLIYKWVQHLLVFTLLSDTFPGNKNDTFQIAEHYLHFVRITVKSALKLLTRFLNVYAFFSCKKIIIQFNMLNWIMIFLHEKNAQTLRNLVRSFNALLTVIRTK